MSDKNWIQKATKNMRKDKPCTGEKFGSESCPPGSKRYNLAKTFRKMAKEGHKLASLEKASVLSASDDPKDQDKAREIRVRHDYENLKKQIGSKKKPDKPAVKEETLDERLGGKGYKPYTSLTGKKVSGDWEDSDRGAGNKAKKRAGGKVEKKSPTYLAHVHNKEEVEIDERTLASYIPSDRQGEVHRANLDYTKAQLKKREDESTKNRGDLSKRDAGKMAKERLRTKKIMSMGEAEDKAFNTVVAALRKKHGKDAVLTKDSPKPKPPSEAQKKKAAAERKKRQDADNKAYAARAKKAGFKSTQDYTDVVARYGSEDNYRKGKGLGT
jgi:hypothetical protein